MVSENAQVGAEDTQKGGRTEDLLDTTNFQENFRQGCEACEPPVEVHTKVFTVISCIFSVCTPQGIQDEYNAIQVQASVMDATEGGALVPLEDLVRGETSVSPQSSPRASFPQETSPQGGHRFPPRYAASGGLRST